MANELIENRKQDGINGSFEHQTSNIKFQNKSQIQEQKPQTQKRIYDIRDRILEFAKQALVVCKRLPKTPECDGIRKQLANAATSIGANFEEADGAITKKDFINKVCISRKEAKEARYWLRIVNDTIFINNEIGKHIKESEEIINILSAIIRNSGFRQRS
jgi:four helix bundle protein